MFSPFASRREPYRFNPVGTCIYCGKTAPSPLTLEHILPQGLGGGLILPKSSCEPCRKITQKIEETCLRNILLPYRLRVGLVQHLHEISDAAKRSDDDLILPVLRHMPGIIAGRPPGAPISHYFYLATNNPNPRTPKTYDLFGYFRMIAKIAHAFTVSQIGIDGFDPALPQIIIGNAVQLTSYLIGAANDEVPTRSNALSHQLGLGVITWGNDYLACVRMRLFAFHDRSPAYNVIAGPLTVSLEQFALRVAAARAANPALRQRRTFDKTRVRQYQGRTTRGR
jgi:hypothetical protein